MKHFSWAIELISIELDTSTPIQRGNLHSFRHNKKVTNRSDKEMPKTFLKANWLYRRHRLNFNWFANGGKERNCAKIQRPNGRLTWNMREGRQRHAVNSHSVFFLRGRLLDLNKICSKSRIMQFDNIQALCSAPLLAFPFRIENRSRKIF